MLIVQDAKEAMLDVKLRCMCIGLPGSGKTYFASTCPKVYHVAMSHGEGDTFKVLPKLRGNIVKVAELVPANNSELRELYGDLDKGVENGLVHKILAEAKELYKAGQVETLVIDTATFLVDYLWDYIQAFCKKYNNKGDIDIRGMYGDLNTKLGRLIGLQLMSFPGNLIVTSHEMLENDEAMEKKIDQTTPVTANILGGFRNKIEGMFSIVMYMQKVEKGGQYQYWARVNKGNQRNAKSRIPLPPTIENISYTTIMNEIKKSINSEGGVQAAK